MRRDRCSPGLPGAGARARGARALTWKPPDAERTRAPASCTAPVPTAKQKTHSFLAAQLGPELLRKYPSLSHLAVLGSPCPSLGRSAPPRPAPATYKGYGASVLAEPHRRFWAPPNPRQSHGSVPPIVPHPQPGLAHPVPSPADLAAAWGGFLSIRPASAGSPLSPDLLTRIRRHSFRPHPGKSHYSEPILLFYLDPLVQ